MDELINEWKSAAGTMSYYNAAEGSWNSEADDRNKCRAALKELTPKLIELGVNVKELAGNYLISSHDY